MNAEVVALVLNADEAKIVLRAVGALVQDEGPSADALAVLEMVAGAVAPSELGDFEEWIR